VEYRLERIVRKTAQLLPTMIPAKRPAQPTYRLVYKLDAAVARRKDLATFFPDSQITYHDDDTATVEAVVTNLWTTRQVLLRYGGACVVIEPPELIEMFRETAREIAAKYLPAAETGV
jgi:predicted DNA-binding transcriptional regulator YafY